MRQIRKMEDLLRTIKKSEVPNTIFLIYDLKEYQIFEKSCNFKNAKNLLKKAQLTKDCLNAGDLIRGGRLYDAVRDLDLSYYDSFDYLGLHIYTAVVLADEDVRKALQRSERAIPEDA
ncbi:hypothetical protein [Anaerolactibacter massiliensis]|uniref:hypothetical protein n=1 Tax=Anaerolactibacter massiliensis TaxID=2044573 RepID=UPI000CFA3FFE|nr:hypothetical protein [Anaerolactibacter massiliensis]